jgi:hypothetical protein
MAITNFIPDIWSARLLTSLKGALVYGGPGVVNRDYQGEISAYGDSVKITSISRPTIGTYTAHTDITFEDVDDATRSLLINQAKYFAFEVDDLEAAQARGSVMNEAATEAAYGLRDVADVYVSAQMAADAATTLDAVNMTTGAIANTALIDLKVTLDEADVPAEGRWVVIPPSIHGLLLTVDNFVRVDQSGTTDGLRNGQVGRAYGFDVLLSNQSPASSVGTGNKIIAGHPIAGSYAEQIANTEAVRLEKRFADGLKGLHLYGFKVVRPAALAVIDTDAA